MAVHLMKTLHEYWFKHLEKIFFFAFFWKQLMCQLWICSNIPRDVIFIELWISFESLLYTIPLYFSLKTLVIFSANSFELFEKCLSLKDVVSDHWKILPKLACVNVLSVAQKPQVIYIKQMYCKKGLFCVDPATVNSSHFIYTGFLIMKCI